jgi:hypothetical protein
MSFLVVLSEFEQSTIGVTEGRVRIVGTLCPTGAVSSYLYMNCLVSIPLPVTSWRRIGMDVFSIRPFRPLQIDIQSVGG